MSVSSIKKDSTMAFELTQDESALRSLLLDVAKFINPASPSKLRFTGGWVRDKLLGLQSHDIDVGIDTMTGHEFGLKIKEYLEKPENASKYGADGLSANLHKIEANPEKSKHLETATTKIFSLDVDLVNLRKEKYSEDSRNPQVAFGSPAEDAIRRDATINAMFYNLQTQEVEDLSGSGKYDLEHGIIRTPLDPYQTFKDDPLRVLRLIRFASRFQYKIDPQAEEAMQDVTIRQALKIKISRERVGAEMEKMLMGPHPLQALSIIDRLLLFETIFVDPEQHDNFKPQIASWAPAYEMAQKITEESASRFKALFQGIENQHYLIWILSAAVPWYSIRIPQYQRANRAPPFGAEAIQNGLKTPKRVFDIVCASCKNAESIITTKNNLLRELKTTRGELKLGIGGIRDNIGMQIREWGPTWKSQLAFAIMLESASPQNANKDIIGDHAAFLASIERLGLLEAPYFKPVVDGNTLCKILETKPGPWVKSALDEVMRWQLQHPNDATPEGAIQAIRSTHGELPSCLVTHLLANTIRPLFVLTITQSSAKVTPIGYKVLQGGPGSYAAHRSFETETEEESRQRRPWKREENVFCLQLLKWIFHTLKADPKRVSNDWALLVPPMLILIDDTNAKFKTLGCWLLTELMGPTPYQMLENTGLGDVFQEALTPCLSFLPPLTPEQDSCKILDAAYRAMFALANTRYPRAEKSLERERMLLQIFHNNLVYSFGHFDINEYPRLMITYLTLVQLFIEQLGFGAIAILSYLVTVTTSVLITSSNNGTLGLLRQGARTHQAICQHTWPRAWRWRNEIMKGVCIAWLSLVDLGVTEEINGVKDELRKVVSMLREIIRAIPDKDEALKIDFEGELANLLTVNDELAELIQVNVHPHYARSAPVAR